MAAPRPAAKPAAQEDQAPPPYFIATAPLYIDGNQFARAHNVGDRVTPDRVTKFGWQHLVRPPDGYPIPDQTPSVPETNEGQAPTTGKGEA